MNENKTTRRDIFSRFAAGCAAVMATRIPMPTSTSFKLKRAIKMKSSLLSFDGATTDEIVRKTLERISFSLPDGQKFFPAAYLTSPQDFDTIWSSPSTG